VNRLSESQFKGPKLDRAFDPVKFEASLAYTERVAALGLSEEEARHLGIGEKRGKVYVPIRYPSGAIAGWQHGDFQFPRQTTA
jgi:hypothetical protein